MSLTSELRPPGFSSTNSYGSVGQQRKTSKLYEAPSYSRSPDGNPVVRVEQADAAPAKEGVSSRAGSSLVAFVMKMGVAAICLLAWTANVLGPGPIMAASQLLGFAFLFVLSFSGSCGVFLWWASWAKDSVGLSHRKALYAYGALCLSEIIASICDRVVDLGPLENFPVDISHYALLSASIQVTFTVFVHEKGAASLFAQESSAFMGLAVLLHLGAEGLFGKLLPLMVYSQLVHVSCLLALAISLALGKLHHNFSLTTMKHMMSLLRKHSRNIIPRTYSGRRLSTASNASSSNYSGMRQRHSITSASTVSSSLPTSYLGGSNSVDLDSLNEAHGVIGDVLLQESSLSQKGKESLKHIHQLLEPKVTRAPRYAVRSPLTVDSLSEADDTDGRNSIGASPHVYGYKSSLPRQTKTMSSTRFSTTTTATGLPFMEEDPAERKPSLALREVRSRISFSEREKRMSVHRMSFRQRLGSIPNVASAQQLGSPSSTGSLPASPSKLGLSRRSTSSDTEMEPNRSSSISEDEGDRQPVASPPRFMRPRAASDTPPPTSKSAEVIRRASEAPRRKSGTVRAPSCEGVFTIPEDSRVASTSSNMEVDTPLAKLAPDAFENLHTKRMHLVMFSPFVQPDKDYTLDEYQNNNIELFEQVHEWDFPIFDMEVRTNGYILSQMAYNLFHEAGLMETFRIPQREFINYFRILEANYGLNTYHNKTHAADVLHATSYLLFEQIPEFTYAYSNQEERAWRGRRHRSSGGNIASAFSVLELFACYMAAAMHDFDHPGRTNAFLVSTCSPLAILYNDRSVLENHHAAASWDLLTNYPEHDILQNLEPSEMKRFRFLLIECILATDLKLHFDILRQFKSKASPSDGGGIDWSSDVDRLMVMKMIIKMADINTPSKSYDLHRKWTVRITEEFFQQHDDETRLGLPQTIFMNRHETEKLPAIQVSFIQNLVSPLFQACAEAGIIPGIVEAVAQDSTTPLPTESTPVPPEGRKRRRVGSQYSFESDKGMDSENEDDNMSDNLFTVSSEEESSDEENVPNEAGDIPVRKVFSVILTNLQINYEGWRRELPEEEGSSSKQDSEELKGKEEEKQDEETKKEKP